MNHSAKPFTDTYTKNVLYPSDKEELWSLIQNVFSITYNVTINNSDYPINITIYNK